MGANPVAFVALYVYVQFLACPVHILIALLSGSANPYRVTKNICDLMGVRFRHTKRAKALHPAAMYLCNHRSWGDFFMDQVLCGGGAYLSRYMVILGCPMSSLYAWLANSTVFFNRKKGLDRNELARTLHDKWKLRPQHGLVVYPEGTRNQKAEPLELKSGVLQMAYEYKKPVQVVITTNKELVANERTFSCKRNVTCVTSVSEALEPTKFADFEAFVKAVRAQFKETWEDAYGASEEDTTTYLPPHGLSPPGFEPLPVARRAWLVRAILALLVAWYLKR